MTRARVRTKRDTRAVTRKVWGLSPTTQGTQIAVREDFMAKNLSSSFCTGADRRFTRPLEKAPNAVRNLSWNPRQKNQNPLER